MPEQRKVFTGPQAILLADVINRIIPAEDGMPGAGDLGLASDIDLAVGDSAPLKKLFLAGLAQIENEAHRSSGKEFQALSPGEQDRLLKTAELEYPEFFLVLVQQTYNSYYTNPAIFPLIGYEGRPPQPQGYPMKPFDDSLLDNVRKRAPTYRQV